MPESRQVAAVAFDLDDTLAPSKSPISAEMASLLVELARLVPVCIISGARFEQFEEQVLGFLAGSEEELANVHLMPTCGTRYLRREAGAWVQVYAEDLAEEQKRRAAEALEECARALGLWEPEAVVHGPRIEDRASQVTLSALGQLAPVEVKRGWDPTGEKREALRVAVQERLPDLEVRAGGSTSVDVTRRGIDKAYGIGVLVRLLDVAAEDVLFVGDRLMPGGNDHPVVALGVATRPVADWEDTLAFLPSLVASLRA